MRPTGSVRHPTGRERERAVLLEGLERDGPLVAFVHGAAGVGKSVLLAAFVADAQSAGAAVVRVDCRDLEPTQQGFLDAIGRVTGSDVGSVDEAASSLAGRGSLVALVIDTYEVFRISDSWLRSRFVPALDDHVRVVIAGREPPLSAWFDTRGAPDRFRSVLLGPLDDVHALEVLERAGVNAADARVVNRTARGHPLALQVAAVALREQPALRVEQTAVPRVVEELTRLYLEHLDAETRQIIDAAAVVRRITAPLLAAMLPESSAEQAIERLAALAFVEEGPDGLRLHEAVQAAVAARLAARDPETHRCYRATAWQVLRKQVGEAGRAELWRYTADMLYLLENPAVREAFFPTTAHLYAVEAARRDDEAAIRHIIEIHEPPEAAGLLQAWWDACPSAFRAVRDRAGRVVGFSVVAPNDVVPYGLAQRDPIVSAWRHHLARNPLPRGQRALLDRCELSLEHGGGPSGVQAATWLDIKRMYLEMRPHLGRLYTVSADPAPYAEALATLGFAVSPAPVHVGRDYTVAWLDFGPESVDGWLTWLAASELGVKLGGRLDVDNRELVLDDGRVALTALEFSVLQCLLAHRGKAVSRAVLIEQAWGHRYTGGSNVVDVVMRSLRKKVGTAGPSIETVRGVGYRIRD